MCVFVCVQLEARQETARLVRTLSCVRCLWKSEIPNHSYRTHLYRHTNVESTRSLNHSVHSVQATNHPTPSHSPIPFPQPNPTHYNIHPSKRAMHARMYVCVYKNAIYLVSSRLHRSFVRSFSPRLCPKSYTDVHTHTHTHTRTHNMLVTTCRNATQYSAMQSNASSSSSSHPCTQVHKTKNDKRTPVCRKPDIKKRHVMHTSTCTCTYMHKLLSLEKEVNPTKPA